MRLLLSFLRVGVGYIPLVAFAASFVGVVAGASAQVGTHPGDRRPEQPDFVDQDAAPRLELPPIPTPPSRRTQAGVLLNVAGFRFQGNTVWSAKALAAVVSSWLERPIASEDLDDIAEAITRFYIDAGYISSGAFIPDQDSDDGTLLIQVVEGKATQIDVSGTRSFRDSYIRKRLGLSDSTPVNILALEQKLQLLQQDPQIRRIDARLTPAIRRGDSILSIDVEEESPLDIAFRYSNHQSPSVGAEGAELLYSQRNLLGIGDLLSVSGQTTSGFDSVEFGYAVPLNSRDTELRLSYRSNRSEVVEAPFDILDLLSRLKTYRVSLHHPVYRTPRAKLSLGVGFEGRRGKTIFLPDGRPFGVPGSDTKGLVKIKVLRFFSDWVWRARRQVVSLRSTASVGLDRLDVADKLGGIAPDGEFFSFLGQAQWVYQLPDRYYDTQLVMRTDLQLADDQLVSMERFAVGGRRSVRGYRENTAVRDNGWVSSVEFRIPLNLRLGTFDTLELAPFFDIGGAWNHGRNAKRQTLASAGVGLRYAWTHHFSAEVYWGGRLLDSDSSQSAPGLQGHGVHMQIVGRIP